MSSNRANLNDLGHNSAYIVFTVILIILSVVGLFLFFRLKKTDVTDMAAIPEVSPSPAIINDFLTSVPLPTDILTPELSPTPIPSAPVPTSALKTFTSSVDKFSMIYKSNRTLYQDKESSGNRYTLYSPQGNIAVHVGNSWSWTYPDRQFSQSFLVSGYPTFIYDIDSQTIVDFQVDQKLFTIQCVHRGLQSLKDECQQFLADFKSL